MNRLRLPVVVAAGIIAVSFASILIKFARLENVPPLVIAAARLGLASAVLLPLAGMRSRREISALTRGDLFWTFVSGIFLSLHFAFWISSFDYTSVMSSVVLVATNPLFVALASVLLLGETLTPGAFLGIFIAVVGGFVIGAADLTASRASMTGDLLALGGAVAGAVYILIGRRVRRNLSLLAYIGVVYSVAAVLLLVAALASGASFAGYSPVGYLLLVLLALLPQLVGHSAFNYALKYISAAFIAVILLAEPVGATLLAVPLLNEIPSPLKLAGGALVLAGILVTSRAEAQPETVEPAAEIAA